MAILNAPAGRVQKRYPAGTKVLTIGDSIFEFADRWNPSGLALEHQVDSEMFWAKLQLSQPSGPRIRHDIWQDGTNRKGANQGVAGDEPALVLARLAAILNASDAPIIVLSVGTNANAPDDQAGPAIASLEACVEMIVATYRRTCVLGTVRPRKVDPSGYSTGNYLWARRTQINRWIRQQAGRVGVVVWDSEPDMLKLSGATEVGEAATGMTVDDVHLAPLGAYNSGYKSLAAALASLVTPGTYWPAVDAAANVHPYPTMAGTSGTASTGVTGTLPTGYLLSRASGSTITAVASKPTSSRAQFVVTSATTPNATDILRLTHDTTSQLSTILNTYGSETWWQIGFDVEFSAWAGWAYPRAWFYDATNGINYSAGSGMTTAAAEGGWNEHVRGVWAPPPLKKASWTSLRSRFDIGVYVGNHPITGNAITGTGTATFRGAWLFQTDNPEVTFPL